MSTRFSALPFTLRRSTDVIAGPEITTTDETIHGVLRLAGDQLVVQARLTRSVSRVGRTIKTDSETEPVIESAIPLGALASATVKRSWWRRSVRLSLVAADLRAFESLQGGLKLSHPAELVVNVRRADYDAAVEFASELELAIAERALTALEGDEPSSNKRLMEGP